MYVDYKVECEQKCGTSRKDCRNKYCSAHPKYKRPVSTKQSKKMEVK